jgi:thimet oligopeptidase
MGERPSRGWESRTEYRRNAPDYSEFKYDQITAAEVNWIIDDAIARSNEYYSQIKNAEKLTWEEAMEPLNKISSVIEAAYGRACFMESVHPDKAVRETAKESLLRLFRGIIDVFFDPAIYQKLNEYTETKEADALGSERSGALWGAIGYMARIGHELPDEEREGVQEKYLKMLENEIEFQKNLDDIDTVIPMTKADLAGMSDEFIASLKRTEDGSYNVTLQYPHVFPILVACTNPETRDKIKLAFDSRAKDLNKPLLEENIWLRYDFAKAIGYESWGQYTLDSSEIMAESPYEVAQFEDEILDRIEPQADEEIKIMKRLKRAEGYKGPLRSSEKDYYLNKAREAANPYDREKAAEYFTIDSVMDGLSNLDEQIFNLRYELRSDVDVWHEDVRAYAVIDTDTGEDLGIIYLDPYPREGKYFHAAAFPLKSSYILPDGTRQKAALAVVVNFPPSGKMSMRDIKILLHEWGHAKHHICSQTEEVSHAGFAVEWDFVEMPSQIMELWADHPEILKMFSGHPETGEQIPDDLAIAMVKDEKLYNATNRVLQIAISYYDQLIHDAPVENLDSLIDEAKKISQFVQDDGAYFPGTWGHIMGGYDALFYGYLWSKVRAAQMFERFEKEGLTNWKTGIELRMNVLDVGGTLYAAEMFANFVKKKKVSIEPYLRSEGIIA